MSNFKKEDIIEDLDKVKDLVILADTEGGKRLIETLTEDIISSMENIIDNRHVYKQEQFVSVACDIKAKLDVVKVLKKAKENEKFLKELLQEAL